MLLVEEAEDITADVFAAETVGLPCFRLARLEPAAPHDSLPEARQALTPQSPSLEECRTVCLNEGIEQETIATGFCLAGR